jgi:hypothetical protein
MPSGVGFWGEKMSYMNNRYDKKTVKKFNGKNYRLTYETNSKRKVEQYAKLRKSDDKRNRYRIVKKGKTYCFYERKN